MPLPAPSCRFSPIAIKRHSPRSLKRAYRRKRMRYLYFCLLVGLFLVPSESLADQIAVQGRAFELRDAAPNGAGSGRFEIRAIEDSPQVTFFGDPTVYGASLRILLESPAGDSQEFALPAEGWRDLGPERRDRHSRRFRYEDASGRHGPVRSARIVYQPGARLRFDIRARGTEIDLRVPSTHNDVYAVLSIPEGDELCARFGSDAKNVDLRPRRLRVRDPESRGCPEEAQPVVVATADVVPSLIESQHRLGAAILLEGANNRDGSSSTPLDIHVGNYPVSVDDTRTNSGRSWREGEGVANLVLQGASLGPVLPVYPLTAQNPALSGLPIDDSLSSTPSFIDLIETLKNVFGLSTINYNLNNVKYINNLGNSISSFDFITPNASNIYTPLHKDIYVSLSSSPSAWVRLAGIKVSIGGLVDLDHDGLPAVTGVNGLSVELIVDGTPLHALGIGDGSSEQRLYVWNEGPRGDTSNHAIQANSILQFEFSRSLIPTSGTADTSAELTKVASNKLALTLPPGLSIEPNQYIIVQEQSSSRAFAYQVIQVTESPTFGTIVTINYSAPQTGTYTISVVDSVDPIASARFDVWEIKRRYAALQIAAEFVAAARARDEGDLSLAWGSYFGRLAPGAAARHRELVDELLDTRSAPGDTAEGRCDVVDPIFSFISDDSNYLAYESVPEAEAEGGGDRVLLRSEEDAAMASFSSHSGVLAEWDLAGASGLEEQWEATWTNEDIMGEPLSRGLGLMVDSSRGSDVFASEGWEDPSADDYVALGISIAPGHTVSLRDNLFAEQVIEIDGPGPEALDVYVSTDEYQVAIGSWLSTGDPGAPLAFQAAPELSERLTGLEGAVGFRIQEATDVTVPALGGSVVLGNSVLREDLRSLQVRKRPITLFGCSSPISVSGWDCEADLTTINEDPELLFPADWNFATNKSPSGLIKTRRTTPLSEGLASIALEDGETGGALSIEFRYEESGSAELCVDP